MAKKSTKAASVKETIEETEETMTAVIEEVNEVSDETALPPDTVWESVARSEAGPHLDMEIDDDPPFKAVLVDSPNDEGVAVNEQPKKPVTKVKPRPIISVMRLSLPYSSRHNKDNIVPEGNEQYSLDFVKLRRQYQNRGDKTAPLRLMWPLQDGNLYYEAGGLFGDSLSGFASLISDRDGLPKSGRKAVNTPNKRHMATAVDVGDYISYASIWKDPESSRIVLRGFMFVAQVESVDRAKSCMVVKTIYSQANSVASPRPGNTEIPEKLKSLVDATFRKLRTKQASKAIFMNEWGKFIHKKSVPLPSVEFSKEGMGITVCGSFDEVSELIKKEGDTRSIKAHLVVFEFDDDDETMTMYVDKKRHPLNAINTVKESLVFSESAYAITVRGDNEFLKLSKSSPMVFFGGSETIFDFRVLMEYTAAMLGENQNLFWIVRTFCG